ncbi:MAG TPA: hypothetical protein VES20_04730 [Bryobacteraceae bacterium]|nr:hypothetical protein [Bryobacteraceae bacterium]
MPDDPLPHIVITPLPVIHPTSFRLTRSNVEYLMAITSGRLCSLGDRPAGAYVNQERRAAIDLYNAFVQITRSMEEYKVAEVEVRLPTATA